MASHQDLITLLEHREMVIADHAWRDRDPTGQLTALREVSEKISAWTNNSEVTADPKLRHFLSNASFAKALAHLRQS